MSKPKSEVSTKSEVEASKSKVIDFSDIIRIEKEGKDGWINFTLTSGDIIRENIKSCTKFIDPSYDSIFKSIFGDGNMCNGKDGNDRLLDLLNSLIIPNEKDKIFTKVVSISNEKSKMNKKHDNSGILKFDISCKATLTDKKRKTTKILDIEILMGKIIDINSLYETYKMDTILIAFINHNYINADNCSKFKKSSEFKPHGEKIRDADDVKVIIVNLKEETTNIQNMKKIFVNEKELDIVGISWLKLLGIRQWGKSFKDYYYLPKNISFASKELESAFIMLQNCDRARLLLLMRNEEEDNNILKVYEKEGQKKQVLLSLIKLFREKSNLFDEMIDIIDFEKTVFNTEDINALIADESEKKNFIKLLGNKRKID
jgi:hypothetical protein